MPPFFFFFSQGHSPFNRTKSMLQILRVWPGRRRRWWVALAGNYLRQFVIFWNNGWNGFWCSVLSEIIFGCNCGFVFKFGLWIFGFGGFDCEYFEQCVPIFGYLQHYLVLLTYMNLFIDFFNEFESVVQILEILLLTLAFCFW